MTTLKNINKHLCIKRLMKRKPNIKVIMYSIIALGFLALTFLVDWMFIIGAIILMYLNQRELKKK